MMSNNDSNRETWSRVGFILAAAGSAIGLGNIWRFPFVLGNNGGFAFLVVYVGCVIFIGLPIMIAELAIGRASQKNPVGAFRKLLPSSAWWLVGMMGLITGTIILAYYTIVSGWTVAYVVKSIAGITANFSDYSAANTTFNSFVQNSGMVVLYHFIFMILCIVVVSQGVKAGIERWSKILMPTLFFLLVLLIVRSITLEGSIGGLQFLFTPDFSKVNGDVILQATGQAFYSLSLGMGAMITYGSYLSRKTNLFSNAATVAGLDMGIAILAGIAIFPALFAIIFSQGATIGGEMLSINSAQDEGLTFIILPLVFGQLPFGTILAILFFLLLTIAALTSAISLLEVMVSFATDELRWTRTRATIIMAAIAFVIGTPCALSFGAWSHITFFGKTFFQLFDFMAANILLPLGGILIAVFVGWVWGRKRVLNEITKGMEGKPGLMVLFNIWLWMVRIVAPLAVTIILVTNLIPSGSDAAAETEEAAIAPDSSAVIAVDSLAGSADTTITHSTDTEE